jgi:hypothetical protein
MNVAQAESATGASGNQKIDEVYQQPRCDVKSSHLMVKK